MAIRCSLRPSPVVALLILTAGVLGNAEAGVDRWTPVGPSGGPVSDVVASPGGDVLYALAGRDVYRSRDGGESWQWTDTEEDQPGLSTAAAGMPARSALDPEVPRLVLSTTDPDLVLAHLRGGDVHVSRDGGDTWAPSLRGNVRQVVYHPADDAFYAWGRRQRSGSFEPFATFRSSDGRTWLRIGQPVDSDVFRPVPHPRESGVLYGLDLAAEVVMVSRDGGVTWHARAALGRPVVDCLLAADPRDGDDLYAACRSLGGDVFVLRSSDGGLTLRTAAGAGLFADPLSHLLAAGDALLLATGSGVLRSTDRGESWEPVSAGLVLDDVTSLAAAGDGTLWAATDGRGVFVRGSGDGAWRPANDGLDGFDAVALDVDPGTGDLVVGGSRGQVLRRPRGGDAWQELGDGFEPPLFSAGTAPGALRTVPSGILATFGGRIYHLATGDGVWRGSDTPTVRSLVADPQQDDRFYAYGLNNLLLWEAGRLETLSSPVPGNIPTLHALAASPNVPDRLYAVSERWLWTSDDAGTSWVPDAALSPDDPWRYALAVPAGEPERVLLAYDDRLHARGDGGLAWLAGDRFAGCPVEHLTADPRRAGLVYAITCRGVERSADGGGTWSVLDGGLPEEAVPYRVTPDPADPDRLYLGTDRGVYERRLADAPPLTLGEGRFAVRVAWRTAHGTAGTGTPRPLTADTGAFWFFGPDNVELVVKVLDGRLVNGHWWVFFASLSNVGYEVTVTDTATGEAATYLNPRGSFASRGDTAALPAASRAVPPVPAAATGAPRPGTAGPDTAGPDTAPGALLLADGRFRVEVEWQDVQGNAGAGVPGPLTPDTGTFWFFRPDNVELVVKVLDGRPVNGHWWVFAGALTNVAYRLTVTDTESGESRTWDNPAGTFASFGDTRAFAQ